MRTASIKLHGERGLCQTARHFLTSIVFGIRIEILSITFAYLHTNDEVGFIDTPNCTILLSESILNHFCVEIYEPPHDKINKTTVRPAKTQISLGIRQV